MRAIPTILLCVALLAAPGCAARKSGLAAKPNRPLPGPPGRVGSQAVYSGVEPPAPRTDPITGERIAP